MSRCRERPSPGAVGVPFGDRASEAVGPCHGERALDGPQIESGDFDVRSGRGADAVYGCAGMNDPIENAPFFGDDAVELVARELQLRGATVPAVHFLEANRAYGPLGSQAMLFFDPVVRRIFGGDVAEARSLLADDAGIERLIERLEELDEEAGLEA
jgi:hypothetical protein